MKKLGASLIILIIPFLTFAQEDSATSNWTYAGLYSFSMSQTSLTNWNAGGENSFNVSGLIRQAADYTGAKWSWNNSFSANYALNIQGNSALKTGDNLEFTTRLDRKINESGKWSASLFANFRTQFADGFENRESTKPISTWMAPGYLTAGAGFTYKTEGLQLYMSPITTKQTYVLDDSLSAKGSFGVAAGETFRNEMGAYLNATYTRALTPTLDLTSNLNLFSNYIENPQNIDVNWETILLLQAWESITVSLHLHLIYDDDILVQSPDPISGDFTAPGTQFKSVLGVGVSYAFGKYKEN